MSHTPAQKAELKNFAQNLINVASKREVDLRLFGSLAVYLHCQDHVDIEKAGFSFNDLDYVAKGSQIIKVDKLFTEKFTLVEINQNDGGEQRVYKWENSKFQNSINVEVFFGKLYFNHLIRPPYFDKLNKYTIPITHLLLSKMTIRDLDEGDINSILLLLGLHQIGMMNDTETINQKILEKHWFHGCRGWCTANTCLNNLKIVKDYLARHLERFSPYDKAAGNNIDKLLQLYSLSKKNFMWKCRNLIGENVKWYREVQPALNKDSNRMSKFK